MEFIAPGVHADLRYEPETGKLFWKERTPDLFAETSKDPERRCVAWNARDAGTEAMTAQRQGYCVGAVLGQSVLAHRVAWAMMTGQWPSDQVDHINGARSDNRWHNLRAATSAENARNRSSNNASTSKFLGVSWATRQNRWHAQIGSGGVRLHLGFFISETDAATAYDAAAAARYGEFARLNFPVVAS